MAAPSFSRVEPTLDSPAMLLPCPGSGNEVLEHGRSTTATDVQDEQAPAPPIAAPKPSLELLTYNIVLQIPPLKTITLKSRPLTTHSIAFSCDAELAVAADDSLHIFLPQFPTSDDNDENSARPTAVPRIADHPESDVQLREQYYTHMLRFLMVGKLDPRMNSGLFRAAGTPVPEDEADALFNPIGTSVVTSYGAALNQIVAMEWSPDGMGYNLRPVIAVMLTSGVLMVYGEQQTGISALNLGSRTRGFDSWKLLWGVGATLPIPDASKDEGYHLPGDKIKSFSWSKVVAPGRAILAYMSDQEEIVILSVQFFKASRISDSASPDSTRWKVEEVARFRGVGPHPQLSVMDSDFTPCKSAFSLKWSPWLISETSRTSIVAYIAKSYVGFRRVTIPADWERGQSIKVVVEKADTLGVCVNLQTDSFLEWEDAILSVGDAKICRGVIATPFQTKPFQVALNGPATEAIQPHPTTQCRTTYPDEVQSTDSINPITSMIIHPSNILDQTTVPTFSVVRLSATATNNNWYQQHVTLPQIHNVDANPLPQWAENITAITKLSVPVSMVVGGMDSDNEEEDDSDEDFDLPDEAGEQIHPYRVRIWGMTSSPAGGMSAVLISQHSSVQIERTVKTKIMFSWKPVVQDQGSNQSTSGLTTEAKLWDWMYGGGTPVPGTLDQLPPTHTGDEPLRELFKPIILTQRCVFCEEKLTDMGRETECENKHTFATCAATGLAILAPGISHACSVCGLRCLVARELENIARAYSGDSAKIESSGDICRVCGGKFLI